MQDLVADAIRGVGGALDRFLAEFPSVAAETALGDEPVLGAGERHAGTFEVDHRLWRLLGEHACGVLVHKPIAAFDGVKVMPMPVVRFHIAQAGGDAAFGRTGVRAQWLQLGHYKDLRRRPLGAQCLHGIAPVQSQRCGQARGPRSYNDGII